MSARTPIVSTVHHPLGRPGGPGPYRLGPTAQHSAYMQNIVRALMRKGRTESQAFRLAWGVLRNWAHGTDGKGHHVSAQVQAAAIKALAQETALRARAKSIPNQHAAIRDGAVDLASPDIGDRTGMIALEVPKGTIKAVPGGLADHHVTLAFLGEDVDSATLARALRAARDAGRRHGPLSGKIGGIGAFPPGPDGTPVWATVDVPGLAELRHDLVQHMGGHASEHGFTPHMTLTYAKPGERLPEPLPPAAVRFRHISVHRGNKAWRFPLTGSTGSSEHAPSVFERAALQFAYGDYRPPYDWRHGWIPITPEAHHVARKHHLGEHRHPGTASTAGVSVAHKPETRRKALQSVTPDEVQRAVRFEVVGDPVHMVDTTDFNTGARSGKLRKLSPEAGKSLNAHVANLDKVIAAHTTGKTEHVHRAAIVPADILKGNPAGKSFTDPGFPTTAFDASLASRYVRTDTPDAAVLDITVPAGSHALNIDKVSGQGNKTGELVLPRGTRFKVTGVTTKGGVRHLAVVAHPPAGASVSHSVQRNRFVEAACVYASVVEFAAWDAAAHPRVPAGSAAGGQFKAKSGGKDSQPPAKTAAQIRDFQRRNHLPVTGRFDAATMAKIQSVRSGSAAKAKSAAKKAASKAKSAAKHKAALKRKAARHAAALARHKAAQRRTAARHATAAKRTAQRHAATAAHARETAVASAVNRLSPSGRAAYRRHRPSPPPGYVWGAKNKLVPAKTARRNSAATAAVRAVLAATREGNPVGKYLVTDLATRRSQVVELASPAVAAGDGPRVTSGAAGGSGPGGLSPRAAVIYRKLVARGVKPAAARKLAARAALRAARAKGTNMARDTGRTVAFAGAPPNTSTSDPADLNTAARRKLARQGKAHKGGSFPVRNRGDLHKAIRAVGRAGGSHAAVRQFLIKRARALNAMDMIPSEWTRGSSKAA